jgi:hypothetical protein
LGVAYFDAVTVHVGLRHLFYETNGKALVAFEALAGREVNELLRNPR